MSLDFVKSLTRLMLLGLFFLNVTMVHSQKEIRLLVRADDMGFSHAANIACIESYQNGIVRTVEVLVPGPWFEEAVHLLKNYPDLDVGIHLALTSEWNYIKWRPITYCPSITNSDGYFYPMIWKNPLFSKGNSLQESDWKLDEIEKEFRAQIELGKKKIPWATHITAHMGCMFLSEDITALTKRLAKEYGLQIMGIDKRLKGVTQWSGAKFSYKEKEDRFINMIDSLIVGTWLSVEHPVMESNELENVGHIGYENVAEDRGGVIKVFKSSRVMDAIKRNGIQLISYADLLKEGKN